MSAPQSDSAAVVIKAVTRQSTGKSYCRKLRKKGKIPGNLLQGTKSTPIELESKLLSKAWQSGKVFMMETEQDSELRRVRIQELQINPIKRTPVHVDVMYV